MSEQNQVFFNQTKLFTQDQAVTNSRGIHLDLKGLPPTPERLLSLLDLLAYARYNAVLVEWEDMFPWTCDQRFRCETAYTEDEVLRFVAKAEKLGIEIIPLVQCLGHMETPLKFSEYAHLREVPDRPDVLNPLAQGGRELVLKMVDDCLRLMPNVKHFHLGGDEAWTFGTHPDTKAYIERNGKGALYMQHVEPLLDHLLEKGVRPILWHDMMVEWDSAALYHLRDKADLMVWGYQASPDKVSPARHYHISHIERFTEHGISMWGGTAYKGADGSDAEIPNPAARSINIQAWTDVASKFGMKGVIATAWSRYNTMLTQCEPIDSSLDMLALAGLVMFNGQIPVDSVAACEQLLLEAGELERYKMCRELVAELGRLKMSAWGNIRVARETLACYRLDPARTNLANMQKRVEDLWNVVHSMENTAKHIAEVFSGLIPSVWVQRFTGDRIEALRGELEDLAARI